MARSLVAFASKASCSISSTAGMVDGANKCRLSIRWEIINKFSTVFRLVVFERGAHFLLQREEQQLKVVSIERHVLGKNLKINCEKINYLKSFLFLLLFFSYFLEFFRDGEFLAGDEGLEGDSDGEVDVLGGD